MTNRKIFRNNRAVAGVIEALLMVALVATVIGLIQVLYIPQIMKQREADHMDEVSNQFSYMKAMIDIQSTTGSNVPIFSTITLGSRELPYLASIASTGDVSVIMDSASRIEIDHANLTPPAYLTSITYEANNHYFVPQSYILEGGGIIVSQPDGNVMRVDPTITVTNETSIVTINFGLLVFESSPGKDTTINMGDNLKVGRCLIRSNYSRSDTQTIPSIHSIQIYTKYVNAWNDSLMAILGGAGTVSKGTNYVQLTPYSGKLFTLVLKRNYVSAQIGPGWVLQI